jgi:hypothetical protein
VPYLATGATSFDGFDAWLRADPVNRDDALFLLDRLEAGNCTTSSTPQVNAYHRISTHTTASAIDLTGWSLHDAAGGRFRPREGNIAIIVKSIDQLVRGGIRECHRFTRGPVATLFRPPLFRIKIQNARWDRGTGTLRC